MQGSVAIVNLLCFYTIGTPMGALLGAAFHRLLRSSDHHQASAHRNCHSPTNGVCPRVSRGEYGLPPSNNGRWKMMTGGVAGSWPEMD
ncbi:hypothetical protein E3N88_35937 [Mikania micrantha]|uniref:Uncharacterized protein n=1 Tax=Mikania micrantha TaxID=192012 RepID=A0A5N6M2F8_9ASTR|nr:hypothetical protein E3N88_35937 [Mikania micrantha]